MSLLATANIPILILVLGCLIYIFYTEIYEKNPITIQLVVVIIIVVMLTLILSLVSYFFPNSKLTKFLKKLIEWFSEGI